MAIFQHSQLLSIRKGQVIYKIMMKNRESWKVKKVILGEFVVELQGIMDEKREKGEMEKDFVV